MFDEKEKNECNFDCTKANKTPETKNIHTLQKWKDDVLIFK
jgi:hypothetical protein